MRGENEIRAQLDYYIEDCEGLDPFDDEFEPQEDICLWCVKIRLLKWVLGELDKPDVTGGMMVLGLHRACSIPVSESKRQVYG